MFGVNTLFILTQTIIMMGLLFVFARKEGYLDFSTLLITMCGIILGNFIMLATLVPKLGWFTAIPIFGFTCWMTVARTDISWPRGILITFLFFILSGGVETGKSWFLHGRLPWEPEPEAASESLNHYDAAMQEGLEVFKELQNSVAVAHEDAREANENELTLALAQAGKTDAHGDEQPVETPAPKKSVVQAGASAAAPLAPPPPPVVNLPAGTPLDWDMARSLLRIKGWMDDVKGTRTALLANGGSIVIGGTTTVDLGTIRYTWRLAAMNGLQPVWHPVSAANIQ